MVTLVCSNPNCDQQFTSENIDLEDETVYCKECNSEMVPANGAVEEFKKEVMKATDLSGIEKAVTRIVQFEHQKESLSEQRSELRNEIAIQEEELKDKREELDDIESDIEDIRGKQEQVLLSYAKGLNEAYSEEKIEVDLNLVSEALTKYKQEEGATLRELAKAICDNESYGSYLSKLKNRKLDPTTDKQRQVVSQTVKFLKEKDYL